MPITPQPAEKLEETKQELSEALNKKVDDHFGLNDPDGSYLHHLTRIKAAYAVGTVRIDDFEEVTSDDEWLIELKQLIAQELSAQRQSFIELVEGKKLSRRNENDGSDESWNLRAFYYNDALDDLLKELGKEK